MEDMTWREHLCLILASIFTVASAVISIFAAVYARRALRNAEATAKRFEDRSGL